MLTTFGWTNEVTRVDEVRQVTTGYGTRGMELRSLFTVALLLLASVVSGQTRPTTSGCINGTVSAEPPDAGVRADFCGRIAAYVTFRGGLQEHLPAVRVTNDVAQIRSAVHALATKIRSTPRRPKEGEIFTPRTAAEFRRRLLLVATADTCETIMDDNPGQLSRPVSRDYPEGKPRSTTPATVLAILPILPPDIEYRFVGRDLILLDTRANIVVDRIANAIRCGRCESRTFVTRSRWPYSQGRVECLQLPGSRQREVAARHAMGLS